MGTGLSTHATCIHEASVLYMSARLRWPALPCLALPRQQGSAVVGEEDEQDELPELPEDN